MPGPAVAPGQRGFALLIVLWTMALLALLGSTITAAGRSETKIAANLVAGANAQAAADAAVAVVAFHLLDATDAHWDPGGPPRTLDIGDSRVSVTMVDQRNRVDPNDAPAGLMAALLRQVGVPGGQADSIGNAITDWRVANDTGLAAAYAAGNRQYGPPHEPFESLDELRLVLGMTPDILARLLPHISLYIEQTPAVSQADPQVQAAIADAVKRDQLAINEGEDPGPLIVRVVATRPQPRRRGHPSGAAAHERHRQPALRGIGLAVGRGAWPGLCPGPARGQGTP